MNNVRRIALAGSLLLPLLTGCISGERAKPNAALRAGCEPDNIQVIDQDGHDLVLDVCGTHENWRWNALNGWEYVGMASTQPVSGPVDADADGVPDDADACPAVAGQSSLDPKANGCPPPPDQDGDGVVDAADACPDVVGASQSDASKNGCPLDSDGDGVYDPDDACPDRAGVATADTATNGCPADQDADGIVDADDACPSEAGPANAEDAAKNGCPDEATTDEASTDEASTDEASVAEPAATP
jgi:hypothetical protein